MINLSSAKKCFATSLLAILAVVGCLPLFTTQAYAKETSSAIDAKVYEFGPKDRYEFSQASTVGGSTFGFFSISGDLASTKDVNDFPAYTVNSKVIQFHYSYDQAKLNTAETEWHLIEDKTKKVDAISLEDNILSGTVIVQTSRDGVNWITGTAKTDVFASGADLSNDLYKSNEIQQENGCYYRVIVAYKLQRKIGEGKILFITTEEQEEKKVCEVYEFYVVSSEATEHTSSAAAKPRKELGQKINTGKDNGYSGNIAIDKDDPHYGWNLGTFIVNGYTRETSSSDGTPVFLKNIGDKVTLWFTLGQDINNLNGESSLTISEDSNGYDQHFEVAQTNFKHGTLIIRYKDFEGNVHDPVIYTDFLAANATTGADTRVQLFEEGDYEVALDYEIKNNPRQIGPVSVIPTYTNYKISFSFSIRNGNCMVYPFDVETNAELSNGAATPNGFNLDMAKSRYLTIDVTRSVLNVGNDGQLTEDIRFNRPAKDNDSYTSEGIYTFKIKNLYTGENTTKTIYVGTDKYLLALSKNALTVDALNDKIAQKATIGDDGTITDYVPPEPEPKPVETAPPVETVSATETPPPTETNAPAETVPPTTSPTQTTPPASATPSEDPVEEAPEPEEEAPQGNSPSLLIVVVILAVVGSGLVLLVVSKHTRKGEGANV